MTERRCLRVMRRALPIRPLARLAKKEKKQKTPDGRLNKAVQGNERSSKSHATLPGTQIGGYRHRLREGLKVRS